MMRRFANRLACLVLRVVVWRINGVSRGVELAAQWHDRCAEANDAADRAAAAVWHQSCATALRRL